MESINRFVHKLYRKFQHLTFINFHCNLLFFQKFFEIFSNNYVFSLNSNSSRPTQAVMTHNKIKSLDLKFWSLLCFDVIFRLKFLAIKFFRGVGRIFLNTEESWDRFHVINNSNKWDSCFRAHFFHVTAPKFQTFFRFCQNNKGKREAVTILNNWKTEIGSKIVSYLGVSAMLIMGI